jgi:hypothetical protein
LPGRACGARPGMSRIKLTPLPGRPTMTLRMIKLLKGLFTNRTPAKTPAVVESDLDEAKLAALRRTAWVPRVEDGNSYPTASKFSGSAALAAGEAWPLCANCGKPLQLFLQLNTAELPAAAASPWPDSLLQVFYCTSSEPLCEVDCEAYNPFSQSTLLRVLPVRDAVVEAAAPHGAFPAKRIVGWNPIDDYPGWEELREADFSDAAAEEVGNRGYPLSGEKLFGWPYWVQGVEYPDCPRCGSLMELLFQIDSENNLPYMFGDAGCGHVTYCSQHPDVLAFRWACH